MDPKKIKWSFIYEDHNADLFPFYYWIDFHLETPGLEHCIKEKLGVFSNGSVEYWVDKKKYSVAAKEVYYKTIQENWFEEIEEKTNGFLRKLLDFGERLKKEDAKKLSNKQLQERLQELEELMAGSIKWGSTPTAMDFAGDDLLLGGLDAVLAKAIEKVGIAVSPAEALATLSMPTRGTFLREEKTGRLRIAACIASDEKLKALFARRVEDIESRLPKENKQVDAIINEHASKYCWINYGYQGPTLPKKVW
ncbi:hypothetical protein HZC09_01985 [Candidatus Micrarchaeota archaeon]|nr:hypothetical protein [Candidatus Micrarchaeota archaeon]